MTRAPWRTARMATARPMPAEHGRSAAGPENARLLDCNAISVSDGLEADRAAYRRTARAGNAAARPARPPPAYRPHRPARPGQQRRRPGPDIRGSPRLRGRPGDAVPVLRVQGAPARCGLRGMAGRAQEE